MPLADSDSDTDWNAQVKILPVRPSSSSSLLHSPHNTSYARNSSQKNFNSKTDHCTRKNTQKPQLRSLRSVARSINNSSCGKCRQPGHNVKTCPQVKQEQFKARAASADLKQSLSSLPINDDNADQEIPAIVPVNSSIDSPNNKCIFCTKNLGINSSGRPLRFCESCKAVDSLRPPIRVPSQVSPLSCIPFSISFRKFTTNLKKGIWDVTPLWKFFLLKDKKLLSSKSKFRPSVMKKEKIVRKLALKGRYGSAKQCLFSSELAECNENTIAQLKSLHPVENFKCPKPNNVSYWEQNPVTNDELIKLINHLPSGKAPGPSMITFDMLKSTINQCPECIDDLVFFFNKILTLKIKLPSEMTSSRLIALKKNESKIRPIAIGKSLSRILASAVFGRIGKKAKDFFSHFQFGIKTVDGASAAELSSDVFFNSNTSNYIFNLDFKNAFNAVKRSSILPLLQTHFPEAESFFYNFYGSQSTLVYEEFNLISSSGVKQGDPLGPFFFCLAIHPLMCELKQEFPDVHITAYMDDISIIGPIDSLRTIAEIVQQRYYQIGLSLNISKCLLIGREPADLIIDDQSVPFINYFESGFRFLGCYLGNFDEIRNQLSSLLDNFEEELMVLSDLNIEKHLKFFFLRICYSGKFTHILRSTSPSISLEFCRIFNELRTKFLANLLDIDSSFLRSHIFQKFNKRKSRKRIELQFLA
ncbi:hypothetical protein P9112_001460 [Eukaryota sp. TZLM1-RC]